MIEFSKVRAPLAAILRSADNGDGRKHTNSSQTPLAPLTILGAKMITFQQEKHHLPGAFPLPFTTQVPCVAEWNPGKTLNGRLLHPDVSASVKSHSPPDCLRCQLPQAESMQESTADSETC